jgi:thiopurine S-methyltransferase
MEAEFWHRKWEANDIFFHGHAANPLLVEYFGTLALPKGSRVFLPLCGKTLDIHWLLSKGHRVAGAELSAIAIEQLFSELGVTPTVTAVGELRRYSVEGIDIFVGDIFDLRRDALGPVDATYDRAALVALPETMRGQYAAHLMEITDSAPQLLICFDYDQSLQPGPPFSISDEEVNRHYQAAYDLTLLARVAVPGGLKGKSPADEIVWLLKCRE